MLKEIVFDWMTERIENKIDTFAACKFGSGNKVRIPGN